MGAVHELVLNASTWGGDFQAAPAHARLQRSGRIERCLDTAPDFHSGGIAGVALECTGSRSCAAVLLSASGQGALRCTLPVSASEVPRAASVSLELHGERGWKALTIPDRSADAPNREWWITSLEDELPRPLQVRTARSGKMRAVTTHSPKPTSRNAVISLSPDGHLVQAWGASEGQVVTAGSWRLPTERRWGGVCASNGFLYAVADEESFSAQAGSALEIWRFDMPVALAQPVGQPE